MKHLLIYISLPVLALTACGHDHSSEEEAHADKHAHAEGVIELSAPDAERFGVAVDTLAPGTFSQVVRAAGRVERGGTQDAVVSAPTAGIVRFAPGIEPGRGVGRGALVATVDSRGTTGGDANAAAAARLEAARLELDRIEDLYDERLATQSELIAAQTELASAKAAYSPAAAAGRAVAPVQGTITSLLARQGQYVQAGEAIATVGSGSGSLLRVDLPQRYADKAPTFRDMNIDLPGGAFFAVGANGGRRVQGPVAAAASGAYLPLYFEYPGGISAGTAFTAYLIGEPRQQVLTVPVSALSEQQGHFYVYAFEGGSHYRKMPVTTGASDGDRTEITAGLELGDVIVSQGVTAVRLAETSAAIPQGHTHNH